MRRIVKGNQSIGKQKRATGNEVAQMTLFGVKTSPRPNASAGVTRGAALAVVSAQWMANQSRSLDSLPVAPPLFPGQRLVAGQHWQASRESHLVKHIVWREGLASGTTILAF
jgi:hypothetical protein